MTRRAFTLIELLVVIAVIALLLAIPVPALSKAKMQAKTSICILNCKTMAVAWTSYATENDEAIMSSYTGYSTYYNELTKDPLVCPNPWVGWAGYQADTADNEERQIQAIQQGVLYPYVKTERVYHCPASKPYELRCYTIPDILGNDRIKGHETLGGLDPVMKSTQIATPGSRIVFLDEGYATFGGYTIYYAQPRWWDLPPIRHDNGVTLGYVDGHSEFYKWRDPRTIETNRNGNPGGDQDNNPDLIMMQRGCFGGIGYSPP